MRIFDLSRELSLIQSTGATLGWDQQTYLPPAGAAYRAEQLAWLAAKAHALSTSDDWKRALEEAEQADDGSDPNISANLRELRRRFERSRKLPVEWVARESAATSLAKQAWVDARQRSDFAAFAPHLETLLGLAREKADLWGYDGEPYDALLEDYERGTSTAEVAALFDSIRNDLAAIASQAVERSAARGATLPPGPYPIEGQMAFNAKVAASMGYDFEAGRIDTTAHPFCTRLGPRDVRLTTRYYENDFTPSLFGVLHEAGHGLYEQGLPASDYGLPSGRAVSLGIHESQSRLWENHIGRSEAFWAKWHPVAADIFPQLASCTTEALLAYVRRSAYSPIRVESDEATYDLHILLRFGLERRMLRGELAVNDVPAAWNDECQALFGFTPEHDRDGCLQDIHWSMGGLGYFPTYSLGNIHAARLHAAAFKDSGVRTSAAQGDYLPLLAWMRTHVHALGSTVVSADVIRHATGGAPSTDDYLAHLRSRYL
jgi:carboxypeptidase Taq